MLGSDVDEDEVDGLLEGIVDWISEGLCFCAGVVVDEIFETELGGLGILIEDNFGILKVEFGVVTAVVSEEMDE